MAILSPPKRRRSRQGCSAPDRIQFLCSEPRWRDSFHSEGEKLARSFYSSEKRRKEIEKQKKKEAKRQAKIEKKTTDDPAEGGSDETESPEGAQAQEAPES